MASSYRRLGSCRARADQGVLFALLGLVVFVAGIAVLWFTPVKIASCGPFRRTASLLGAYNDASLGIYQRYQAGSGDGAYADAVRLLQQSEQSRNIPATAEAHSVLAELLTARGDLPQAERHARLAFDQWLGNGDPRARSRGLYLLACVHSRQGNYGQADSEIQESLELRASLRDEPGVIECLSVQSRLSLAGEDYAAARGKANQALAIATRLRKQDMVMDLRGLLARADDGEGNHERAAGETEKCLLYWQRKGHSRWVAAMELQLGGMWLRARRFAASEPILLDSARRFGMVHDRWGEAEAHGRLYHCFANTNRLAAAGEEMHRALTVIGPYPASASFVRLGRL